MAHGADMFRSSAAASTNQLHAGAYELPGIAGHVLRRAKIDVAALDRPRHSGVRLGSQGKGRHSAHALHSVKHSDRADAAVAANHVGTPLGELRTKCFGTGTVETVSVFVDGHMGDDGYLRSDLPASENRLMDLFEVPEGFQHEDVDAPPKEGGGLLAERLASLFTGNLAQRLDADTDRADRAGN